MNYNQTTEYLFSAMPSFQSVGGDAYKPGLERMRAFCEVLGNPQFSYPVIHIAGTNGKGSTSHMIASMLQSAGYRVGLFTSPHLRDFRERMRINGAMISESEVVDFVERYRGDMEQLKLSFFEMTASMAFDLFARSGVDVAVIETGLGGRLDATNIVTPQLSVITNIAIDHTQYLGDTRAKIAAEKAGIIKSGVAVIVGERGDESDKVFCAKGAEMGSEVVMAEDCYRFERSVQHSDRQDIDVIGSDDAVNTYTLDLMGSYQRHNIITALTAIDYINGMDSTLTVSEEAVRGGLRSVIESTGLRGRWQRLGSSPTIICDTGHNMHGLREVTEQLSRQTYNKLYCVLGFAKDKDIEAILPLFPREAHYIFTRARVERAFDIATLVEVGCRLSLSCEAVESVEEALQYAKKIATPNDMIFVGGSTFVVAEIDLFDKAH